MYTLSILISILPFKILSNRDYLDYFPEKEYNYATSIGNIERVSNQIEIIISQNTVKDFKAEKIGEITKLDKIKNCLIHSLEGKKVIVIEEELLPNLPFTPNPQ